MSLKNKILLLSFVLFFLIIVYLLLKNIRPVLPKTSNKPQNGDISSLIKPNVKDIPVNKDKKMLISNIEVNNILISPVRTDTENYLVFDNGEYQILYIKSNQKFNITILRSPFLELRDKAEQTLLDVLNITKDKACGLSVEIGTTLGANPDFAGKTYSLSFCK